MKKDISFSIPRNSDAHHQLFRETGSWMVHPLWWNVTFWSNDFRSVSSSSSISQWRVEWRHWCDK